MSLRNVLALPREVVRREKGRMEMTERMGERSWMNVQMSVCQRAKGGRKKNEASLSRSSPKCSSSTSYHRRRALEQLSRIRMAVLDLQEKPLSRTTAWKRAGVCGVCHTLFRSLREQENNTKEPRVSIKDWCDHGDSSSPENEQGRCERSSLLLLTQNLFS